LPGRALYRKWLLWLGDPQPSHPMPSRPLPAASVRELVQTCARHGVLPAAARKMRRLSRDDAARLIDAEDSGTAANALERILEEAIEQLATKVGYSELLRVAERNLTSVFRAHGIEFLILKGTSFADRLYPDPTLRPFTDIDILVPAAAMPQARTVMAAAGLAPLETASQKHAGHYAEEKWRYPLLDGLLVELHWDLVTSPKVRQAVSLKYEDLRPLVGAEGKPSACALLLVAAVHGAAGHGFESLQHVVDVAQAARGAGGTADPRELVLAAKGKGQIWAVQVALVTAALILSDRDCARLARAIGASKKAWWISRILGTATVLEAGGPRHARYSWRRQLYREAFIRLADS